jgi:hypothetical protein
MRAIWFLGSVFTRLLAPVQLLPLRRLRMSERLLPLRQPVYTVIICLHRLCTATLVEVTHNE